MSIGLGIFLMALGAILSFAVSDRLPGVNLVMIGWILMGAGLVTVIMSLITSAQRNRSEHVAIVEHRDTGIPRETHEVRETREYRDPRDPRI